MKKFLIILITLFIQNASGLKCYQCSDTQDCVEGTFEDDQKIDCEDTETHCGVWIAHGKTMRDCVDLENNPITGNEGFLCASELCNEIVFPPQRLKCHQCSGKDDDCVKLTGTSMSKLCLNYELDDKCYVGVEDDRTTHRGCDSDENKEKCNELGDDYCIKGPVNDQPGTSSDFSCVKCESTDNNDTCATTTTTTSCGEIPLGRSPQCFTVETGEEIIRNCYYGPQIPICDSAGNCKKCDTSGCNTDVYHSLKCQKCDSCESGNKNTGFCYVTKDNVDDLACYHQEEDNGNKTTKGCLNKLDAGLKAECKKNDDECKICRSNECNHKPLFQKCYKCDSKNDRNCVTDLAQLTPITCPNYDAGECATWIEEQTTYRDCSAPSETPLACICKANLCNNKDCPENRLKCYQCEPNCVEITTETNTTCKNYKPNDKCYVVIEDSPSPENTKGYRGCKSDTGTTGIDKCNEFSQFCITGENNNQTGASEEFKCVQCRTDSISEDDACVNMTQAVTCGSIPLGREIKCFTLMNGDKLVRECYYGSHINECDNNKDDCDICPESGCNTTPFRSLKCRKCNRNEDCNKNATADNEFGYCMTKWYEDEDLACYRQETDNGVVRGCLNRIDDPDIKDDCKKNSDKCKICTHEKCNDKMEFQRCFECDSSNDANCATLAFPDNLPRVTCPGYHDICAVSLTGIAVQDTRRSCISNKELECLSGYCESCDSNYCNGDTFPKNRTQCHRCTEDQDENCVEDLLNSSQYLHYCPKYDMIRGDTCFGVIDTSGLMIRGCLTDFELYEKCIEMGRKCLTCNNATGGCNSGPKIRAPLLKCIDCEPSNLLGNCLWGVNPTKAVNCKEIVKYGDDEECFTVEYESDVVRRGCLNDLPDICDDPKTVKNCTICPINGCNNENVIKQACIVCHSADTPACKFANPNIASQLCTEEVQEFDERWCYTMTNPLDGEVKRGCFMDLTDGEKNICLENTLKICDICHDWGCNKERPPNAGNMRHGSVFVVILVVLRFLY